VGWGDKKERIPSLISLFGQQVKVNCQTERNAEITCDKDTRKIKINSFFTFHGSYKDFCNKGKPTVFGTAFDCEPGFKTKI